MNEVPLSGAIQCVLEYNFADICQLASIPPPQKKKSQSIKSNLTP